MRSSPSGSALSRTDALLAAEAAARHLALALEVGSQVDVARALVWEVLFTAVLGEPSARVREVIRAGRSAVRAHRRPRGARLVAPPSRLLPVLRSRARLGGGARRSRREPRAASRTPAADVFVRSTVGRVEPRDRARLPRAFADLALELPAHLDEAWARADMCIAPMWAAMVLPRLRSAMKPAPRAIWSARVRRGTHRASRSRI